MSDRNERAIELIDRMLDEANACELVISLARQMCKSYTTGMLDSDPHKGIGNHLADALAAYDRALAATHAATSTGTADKGK